MAKQKPEMTEAEENELRENPVNVFRCDACKDSAEMVFEEFKHHLFTVHKLNADQMKGRKQMIMHMDGVQWFSSTYKWTLETGLTFHQYVTHARQKDDPMRHG